MNIADIWVTYFWIRFKNSDRVRGNAAKGIPAMKDYQKFWYHSLLMESIYSERPGLIPNDMRSLFRLAGCTASFKFFCQEAGCVLESFQRSDDDAWLFHPRAKEIAEKLNQVGNQNRAKKSSSLSTRSGGSGGSDISSLIELSVVDFDSLDKCVEELFSHYVKLFDRKRTYTLTEQRRKKCAARLVEFMKANHATLRYAQEAAIIAMENLRNSEFHWTQGYYDWIDNLFKSQEEFQKRLEMKANGNGNYSVGGPRIVSAGESRTNGNLAALQGFIQHEVYREQRPEEGNRHRDNTVVMGSQGDYERNDS